MNESEFLASYDLESYERPSVTADVAAFMMRSEQDENYRKDADPRLSLLLIQRGGYPFKGCWALPGGFLQSGETIENCAMREIEEETSVTPVSLLPVGIFSEPGRDPRGWIISGAYACVISEASVVPVSGDDAGDAGWFDVSMNKNDDGSFELSLKSGDVVLGAVLEEKKSRFGRREFIQQSSDLAFDHACIIASALSALQSCAKNFDMIFGFLPEKFTLSALQSVWQAVSGQIQQPANFRRKVAPFVEQTEEYEMGAGHRPARLYIRKGDRNEKVSCSS